MVDFETTLLEYLHSPSRQAVGYLSQHFVTGSNFVIYISCNSTQNTVRSQIMSVNLSVIPRNGLHRRRRRVDVDALNEIQVFACPVTS